MEPPAKRQRLNSDRSGRNTAGSLGRSTPQTLSHSISPPRRRNRKQATPAEAAGSPSIQAEPTSPKPTVTKTGNNKFRSPFQLTWVRDLPDEANTDAVTLGDILGDPLISECWDFNYLHDINFLLSHLDQDVRKLVKVHVIHGFWKKEDPSRLELQVSLDSLYVHQSLATADTCYRSRQRATRMSRSTAPSCPKCLGRTTPRCWSSSAMTTRPRSLSTRRT